MSANHANNKIIELTPERLRDIECVARLNPRHEVPAALKRLRLAAGLTQLEVGRRFHRRSSAVSNWEDEGKDHMPPKPLIPALLDAFGVPRAVIQQFVTFEIDGDLSAAIYAKGDPVIIEFDWWTRNRGKALQLLISRAQDGDTAAIKLLFERGDKIEARHAAYESKPQRTVGQSATWTRQALAAGLPPDDPAPTQSELPQYVVSDADSSDVTTVEPIDSTE